LDHDSFHAVKERNAPADGIAGRSFFTRVDARRPSGRCSPHDLRHATTDVPTRLGDGGSRSSPPNRPAPSSREIHWRLPARNPRRGRTLKLLRKRYVHFVTALVYCSPPQTITEWPKNGLRSRRARSSSALADVAISELAIEEQGQSKFSLTAFAFGVRAIGARMRIADYSLMNPKVNEQAAESTKISEI